MVNPRRTKRDVIAALFDSLDASIFSRMSDAEICDFVADFVSEYARRANTMMSNREQAHITELVTHDIIGFGPLQPLLQDDTVSDILVNGPAAIWVERKGRLQLSDVHFDDDTHLRNMVNRILGSVNRRVDEVTPMVDARLPDGSRINVAIPPVSYKFTSVSIRKFLKRHVTLDDLVSFDSLSPAMATMLKIAARRRLNILVSGGTGTGKTTLLQAICHHASDEERIVTIEDTGELMLRQPDVVPLEARPANIEGKGEITIANMLRNALRMRPDRIILGEVRGAEAAEMLQAMNTGHDGSIGTVHANSARDAIARFEYMACMSAHYQPGRVVRQQIVNALDLVVHLQRMKDGKRRIVSITEVVGIEQDTVLAQDVATFELGEELDDGTIRGEYVLAQFHPQFISKMRVNQASPEEAELIRLFSEPRQKSR